MKKTLTCPRCGNYTDTANHELGCSYRPNTQVRILITGSRDWTDRLTVYRAIIREIEVRFGQATEDNPLPGLGEVVIVHGGCPTGADDIADDWALGFFETEVHPAEWKKYGKRAGYLRNKAMVDAGADVCLAFIKNGSKGATMTANLAKEAGIPTRIYREGGK